MDIKGISILYLSIGSGHQIAAESLAETIKQTHPEMPVIVEDPFINRNKILPKIFNAFQAITTTMAPDLYDLAWRGKAGYDSYQWLTDVGILQEFLIDHLTANKVETIIATHVIPCILGVGLKKRSLIKNVFGVITDFGAHSLWPTEAVDGYFVASEELKNTLIFRGIKSTSIHVTGIPIKKIQKSTLRKKTSKIRVLLIAGGIQGGAYTNTYRYIFDLLDIFVSKAIDNVDLTIVTGNQKVFKKELAKHLERNKINVRLLGFVRNIPKLMMKNDVLITKSGGLIISEALAVGTCIILTESGPGQERANYDFLARHGIAFKGDTPDDVVRTLEFLTEYPNVISEMRTKAKKLGYPNSAETIAKIIINKA